MANLKIVWYNVLRGFHKKELDGTFTFEKKRLNSAKKIIAKLNPDILFIGEGDFNPRCKISGPKIKTIDYKNIFDYKFDYYSKPDKSSRKGEVVLSKFPIKAKDFSRGDNTFIKTWFKISNKKINIDIIHPYPTLLEKEKAKWVGEILKTKETPYIILGDFNSLSPKDKQNYKFSSLVEEFTAFQGSKEKATRNTKDNLKCLMLKKVISEKLVDSYLKCNKNYSGTLPTKKYASSKNKSGIIRIDYIFCSKEFKILDSGILKNNLSEIASDHYPIYALLEI
ncbi:MAG: endonuclease/exonuclease/phosphatase family protein [Nanoarchaeota archaeon]|nr:endonuclease/exonuclease/phosphatase family protein [Nanoarchaeota archaeon]